MNGGLGNQIFQFMFYHWYRKLLPQVDVVIDDGKFWGDDVPHHGYELKRIFNLDLPMLSQRFSPEVWQYMIELRQQGTDIPEQLRMNGLPLRAIREKGITNIKFNGDMQEFAVGDSLDIDINDNIYWHGYWLSSSFLSQAKEEIMAALQFLPFDDELNLQLQAKIIQASEPTAIHIRRGDMAAMGWSAQPEYYQGLIRSFDASHNVSLYLLFSDDIAWCEDHAAELGLLDIAERLLVVDNNQEDDYWRDLQLMSLCKNRLSDRSSFSLLAGFLCNYPQKEDWNNWGSL
ncbi:MAG: alpha-1,2-fucosyltransferase [Anaerovibrio sp.]|nr:alpha-1,2-fucosyltransferase [Anaerovibrio sp.]